MDDLLDLSWSEPSKKPAAGASSGGLAGSSFDMLSRPKGANYYSGTSTPAASSKPASAKGSSANLAGMVGTAGSLGGLRPSTSTTPARTTSPATASVPSANAGAGADAFSDLLGMSGAGPSKNLSMAEKQAQLAAQKAKADEEERQRWGDGAFFDQLAGGGGSSSGGTAPVTAPKPSKLGAALQPTQSATSSRPTSTAPSKPAAAAKPASAAGSFWDDDDLLGGNKAKPSSPAPAQPKPAPKAAAAKGSFWDDDLLNGSSGDKAKKDDMAWDDDDAAGLLGNAGGGSSSAVRPADPWDFDALATSVPSSGAGGASAEYGDDDDDLLGELGRPAPARPRSPESRGARPTSRGAAHATPTAKARSASPPPHIIGQIVEMGFAPDRARAALAATDSGEDVQAALEMLLGSRGGTPAGGAPDHRNYDDDDDEDEYARERAAEARYAEEEQRGEDARRARHAARRRGPNRDTIRPRTQDERDREREGQGAGTDELAEHADRLMAQASEIGSSMLSKASMFWSQGKEKALKVYEEQRRALEAQQSAARRKPPADGRPRWMVEAEEAERAGAGGENMPPSAEFGDDALGFHDSDEESGAPPPAPAQAPRTKAAPAPANAARVRADEPKKAYVSPFRHGKGRGGAASPAPAATPVRPPSPLKERALVPASAGQVSTAAGHKEKGNEHFKLGRFAEAESAYTAAITALPAGHIHLVPLHNNRAATWLKLGEPGRAAADCAVVIELVGPAYHPNKEVPLPSDVGVRLGDALVKATAKRAQAHEMAEKWKLALDDWEKVLGYDAALGGAGMKSQASDGIRRAKAMLSGDGAGGAAAPSRPKPKPKPRATPSRPTDVSSSAAVSELRAAAAAAEAEDEQRAALKDSVEERLVAWKKGKETNIRALLASLDSVLWDAVLVRVGMHELVTPKQVKIKYMKVIARLHPDKLASATVEQKMIANGVFGALSEAYTAFNNGA